MSQAGLATPVEHLVSDADYVQLRRLVIEHVWRSTAAGPTPCTSCADDGEIIVPRCSSTESFLLSPSGLRGSLPLICQTRFVSIAVAVAELQRAIVARKSNRVIGQVRGSSGF